MDGFRTLVVTKLRGCSSAVPKPGQRFIASLVGALRPWCQCECNSLRNHVHELAGLPGWSAESEQPAFANANELTSIDAPIARRAAIGDLPCRFTALRRHKPDRLALVRIKH